MYILILSGNTAGSIASLGSTSNATSPLEVNVNSGLLMPKTDLFRENVVNLHPGGQEGVVPKPLSDLCMQPAPTSYALTGNKIVTNVPPCESSLFSSSLSDIYSQKCKKIFHA